MYSFSITLTFKMQVITTVDH